MKLLRRLSVAIIVLVLVAGTVAYVQQDGMLFHPQTERVAPTQDYIEAVEINTEDGETLVAWYSPAAQGCPTFLFMHGNASRIDLDKWRYERLHKHGAGFLALSWRGYAGSTGRPGEKGFHRDAEAGWKWLLAHQIVASDVIIHGFSIGTGPATKLASSVDEGLLVLEAPFYSMEDLILTKAPLAPTWLLLKHKFRSDRYIASAGSPVFMAHGTADRVIPIEQSRRLYERAPESKAYKEFEGSDHNTLVRDGLYDALWPFITANWTSSETFDDTSHCYLAVNSMMGASQ